MQIHINFDEVFTKTTELRRYAEAELREANTIYRQAASALNRMDGSTNSEIINAVQSNQAKAEVTINTLTKLLAFIDTSARQVERAEQTIARTFRTSTGRVRTRR